ncbi:MAG TPA: 23S rRNA (guanosine(2251)-2'-O)-methyltransferase RlmB [Catalimonadaceae bacterium]|nr:23S rRNA (guanosine(2251)-2'-O)-methyltransferase RlmB [Catalimonadaceae bacterium]
MEKRSYKPVRQQGYSRPAPTSNNIVIGLHPVAELLKSDKEVEKLLINRELLNRQEGIDMVQACRTREIPYQVVPVEKLNRVTPKMHQGVVAFVSPIVYQKIEHLVPLLFEQGVVPFILILDRVTDVRNFGAIARTCECAGVHAIVVPEKGAAQINDDAMKTSAGALNHIPICRERDLGKTLNFLNDSGLTLVAVTEKGNETVFDLPMTGPVAMVMGSEEDGISEFLLRKVHHEAKFPQAGKIGSLNVSVATGIALFEVVRQRLSEA